MAELILPDDSGYALCGCRGTKLENSDVMYVPYLPIHVVETDEEREARVKRKRAGKSFAKVKLSNDNPCYRHKRGEIVDRDQENKRYCLEIETVNRCSKSGHTTWIGVIYPSGYEKIWFNEDELENFEAYDESGELIE